MKLFSGMILAVTLVLSNVANAGLIQWDQIADGDYFSIRSGANEIQLTDDFGVPQIPVLFVEATGEFANFFGNAAGYSVDQIDFNQPNTWTLTSLWDFSNGVSPFENLILSWLPSVTNRTDSLVQFAGEATLSDLLGSINLVGTGQIENKTAPSGAGYGQFDATFTAKSSNSIPGGSVSVNEPAWLGAFLLLPFLVKRKKQVS